LVSPAGASPSLSYPGGWHTTARPRGKRGNTNGRAREERKRDERGGTREGQITSARRGISSLGRSETRRRCRRPPEPRDRGARGVEARAVAAGDAQQSHPGRGGGGMHVSASGSAIATNLAPTRMEEGTALSARAIFFPRRPPDRGSAARGRRRDCILRMKFFCETSGGDERREVRRSYGMSARWSY
jgi:hypothetical protein